MPDWSEAEDRKLLEDVTELAFDAQDVLQIEKWQWQSIAVDLERTPANSQERYELLLNAHIREQSSGRKRKKGLGMAFPVRSFKTRRRQHGDVFITFDEA